MKFMRNFMVVVNMKELIKKKKKADTDYHTVRLTKKGKEILSNSHILDYTVEDEALLDYLKELYKGVEKPIGNDIKVKQLLDLT